jgi:hypothetical protein
VTTRAQTGTRNATTNSGGLHACPRLNMASGYQLVSAADGEDLEARYPPLSRHEPPSASATKSWLHRRSPYTHLLLGFILGGALFHFSTLSRNAQAIKLSYAQGFADNQAYADINRPAKFNSSNVEPGTFYRDPVPLKTAMRFYNLAEHEIAQRDDLKTCDGQLSKHFMDAYVETEMEYCEGETTVACLPMHRASFNNWWPYPSAPCLSSHLRPVKDQGRRFRAQCKVTDDGKKLDDEMGHERFLGMELLWDEQQTECKQTVDRTLVFIGRQDQWNP